ncbi:unnamed protein product [Sphagnum troendelagicum]|uniref:GPI-anchored protein LLG1-like domain-containing protein n=1 Tax=Sphagnum troendelagicum TaxID=128251 RepID=A0ABP0TL45_9BRYO
MGVDVLHLLVPQQQQQQLQVFLFILLIGTCIIILAALADLGVAAPAAKGDIGVRKLLQAVHQCPENFGLQNYSSITSVCKAPDYDKTLCCSSFTMFTCRFLTYFNDPSTNCASTLFTYLNLAGNYPPGLFANLCTQGDQQGIPCPITPAPSPNPSSALSLIRPYQSSLASSVLISAFVLAVVMIT